jgi:hypothetical protein
MKIETAPIPHRVNANGQRGAALISTLLISALLLTAGGILILTTSMAGTNTIDAAAEMQAYYGAEAGLQAALNVMRGNVMPKPLFAANPPGGVATENKITFLKAKTNSSSNLAGDPPTLSARLSRWVTYNYRPPGGTYDDRVGISPDYNPFNGIAYRLTVNDPGGTGPARLIIESTGYGPRGARKKLSLMIVADGLGIETPATLVMRGHANHFTPMSFILGGSASKEYLGSDLSAPLASNKPAFAVSGHDAGVTQGAYASKPDTVSDPKYAVLDLPAPEPGPPVGVSTVPTPWYLRTANDARAFLAQAEALALKKGRVVSSLDGAAGTGGAPEFILVKGNCKLNGGAGLLIVTGDLEMKPAGPPFHGVILILGGGTLNKTGGGNRTVYGSITIARFGATGDFLEPTFNYGTGSGTSKLQYDSGSIKTALELTAPLVLGVVEK